MTKIEKEVTQKGFDIVFKAARKYMTGLNYINFIAECNKNLLELEKSGGKK